jgi:hypothetical protein
MSNSFTSQPPPFVEQLVGRGPVAKFIGMSERGLSNLLIRGEGPPYLRIGRLIRFSPTAVKAWAASQTEITLTSVEIEPA